MEEILTRQANSMDSKTTFTAQQVNAILSMAIEGRQGRLSRIEIRYPDVQGTVYPELLQAASLLEDLLFIHFGEDEDLEDDSGDFSEDSDPE